MKSPFASLTASDPIPMPNDPDNSIVVRKLTARECETAQRAHARNVLFGTMHNYSENFKRVLEKGIVEATELAAALNDPLTGFDPWTLVRLGLMKWTYPQSLKPVEIEAAVPASDGVEAKPAVMYDAIDDLGTDELRFIALEVLKRTRPALFQTEDEAKAERKNDSSGSIAV